jgi:hypothetical protein
LDQIKLPAVQLAAVLGITENELTKLARRGDVPREPNPEYPREWVYPLAKAVSAYVIYLRRDAFKAQQEFLIARTRAQTATAAKKELEIALKSGTLIKKTAVIRALEPLVILMRDAVLTRADRLERAITSAKGRKAKLAVIRASDLEVLEMFADIVKPLKPTSNGDSALKAAS